MLRDLTNNIEANESVRPAVHSADITGEVVDLRGSDSAAIVASIGAIVGAGANGAITLEESDEAATGFTAVASTDILGTLPTALTASTAYQFGYIGGKRYIRAVIDTGTETSIAGSVMVVKGHLHQAGNTVTS